MGNRIMKLILALDNFEIYDIFRKQPNLTNWGFQGQNSNFVNFMLNYGKHAYLGLIGTIGNEN